MSTQSLNITGMLRGREKLILVIGWALVCVEILALLVRLNTLTTVKSDFTQDYLAVRALQSGSSIYDTFPPEQFTELGLQEATFTNFHPPFNVLLFFPLAQLPYGTAIWIWTWLSAAIYLAVGYLCLRECGVRIPAAWLPLVAALAMFWNPFQFHVILGQISIPLAACVIGAWALLRRKHDTLAGLLLGLAILIKIFPALLVLYLVCCRRWRALIATAATCLIGMGLTIAVVGVPDVLRYQREMIPLNMELFQSSLINVSISAIFYRLLVGDQYITPIIAAPQVANVLALLANAAVALVLVYQLWWRRLAQRDDARAVALCIIAMILLNPTSWTHSYTLLLLPLAVMLRDALQTAHQWHTRLCLIALTLVSLPDISIARWIAALYNSTLVPWYATLPMAIMPLGLIVLWWVIQTKQPNLGEPVVGQAHTA